jgi:hypothetical protein
VSSLLAAQLVAQLAPEIAGAGCTAEGTAEEVPKARSADRSFAMARQ